VRRWLGYLKLAVGRRPELLALAGDDEEWRARPVEESTLELFLT
jgi:hypothetical protein